MATDDDIRKALDSGMGVNEIRRELGVHHRRIVRVREEIEVEDLAGGFIESPDERWDTLEGKRFVFTSAQNNTHVHAGFLKSLEKFCKHRDAKLVISPFVYNKNGFQNGTKKDEDIYFDPKVVKYFCDEAMHVCDGLVFCGNIEISPTAKRPLSGFDVYNGASSCIFPSTKVAMEPVATMKHKPTKHMYTTGAVTQRNYIQRKTGQIAEFHHSFAALFVEVDEKGNWYARQLVADDSGVFHDLDERFEGGRVTKAPVEAISWGDIHTDFLQECDIQIMEDMLEALSPRYQFMHDVLDFRVRNHHSIKDKFHWAEQYYKKHDSVLDEIGRVSDFLNRIYRDGCETVVVESNHDLALKRWLTEAKTDFDPANAEFYHLANARMYRAIREGEGDFQVFKWALDEFTDTETCRFLKQDDSFVIAGDIECAMHGHLGANGSRGNPRTLRKIGTKSTTGHTHSAGIYDGVYVGGVTASKDMGYNRGPSSWSHSHVVTYANGKRAIVTIADGKWREKDIEIEAEPMMEVGMLNIYGIEVAENDLELD